MFSLISEWNKELEKRDNSSSGRYKPSLIKAIIRTVWIRFVLYQQINIWGEIAIRLFQPFLVGILVRYLSQPALYRNSNSNQNFGNHSSYHSNLEIYQNFQSFQLESNQTNYSNGNLPDGYVSDQKAIIAAVILIISSFVFAFSRHPAFVLCIRLAGSVRSALTVMIYRKVLKLSKSSFEQTDIGQILNILANDLNRFEDVGWQLPYILIGPTMSVVVIYISYKYLGIACIGGLVILILFIPFQGLMGRLFQTFRYVFNFKFLIKFGLI